MSRPVSSNDALRVVPLRSLSQRNGGFRTPTTAGWFGDSKAGSRRWIRCRRRCDLLREGNWIRGKNVKQEVLLITGEGRPSRVMRNTLHNADRGSEPAEKDPLNGATPQPLGRRTAAAGSEFLKALGSDLAALAAQLEELLTVMRERLAGTSAAAIAAMLALAARLRQLLTAMRKRLASASAPVAMSA